ncbi:MAG: peptidylprolyl isomerase [Pseudomonadota bacterium]
MHFPERSRRNGTAWLAVILLMLAAGARAEVQWLDRIAAIVDNDVIMESDVAARMSDVRLQMAARKAAPPPADVLRRQVVERLVIESIQLQLGTRMGVRIDDESLNSAVAGIARQNGASLREFIEQLTAEGIDYATFREQVRRDMVINRVRQRRVGERVRISDADVAEFMKSADARDLFGDSYRVAHILVAVPESAGVEQVQAATAKANALLAEARGGGDFSDLAVRNSDAANALEGGDLGWRTGAQLPPLFANAVTGMKPGDIVGPLRSASGFHVVKLLERKGEAARVVQQTKIRHVLVKPSAIRTPGEARELAQQLHDRIAHGDDFADVAKRHSEDTGSALAGGDLGWVSPGQMVEEFEAAATATTIGALSPVFETRYGWHFLQVLERRDQDTSEDYRRLQARNAVWKRKYDAELDSWMREIRNEAFVDIKPATGTE